VQGFSHLRLQQGLPLRLYMPSDYVRDFAIKHNKYRPQVPYREAFATFMERLPSRSMYRETGVHFERAIVAEVKKEWDSEVIEDVGSSLARCW